MFEAPLPVTLPPTTDFQHADPVRTLNATPAQILQNQTPDADAASKKPAHSSSLPTMSNIPSEPEFEQAYNGMLPLPWTMTSLVIN